MKAKTSTQILKLVSEKKVKDLEKELLETASSDDEFDFGCFGGSLSTTLQAEKNKSVVIQTDADPGFVIDRSNDDASRIESSKSDLPKSKKSGTNRSKMSRKELIEWVYKVPTEINVEVDGSHSKPAQSSISDKNVEVMKKAVVGPDFEKKQFVPPYSEGKKAMARKRREERASTKGSGWFDMKAPEMTDELQADIEALQMRGSLGAWNGYKKNDYKGAPKFFQVATVQDSPVDFYHSRIPKKERKRTLVDELLSDADFRKNNKKMYMKTVSQVEKKRVKKKKA